MSHAQFEGFDSPGPHQATSPTLAAALESLGSAGHSHLIWLTGGNTRPEPHDIADVAHFLCLLHGRLPGLLDQAANHTVDPEAGRWLLRAVDGFAAERALLAKLTVEAGPIASTPGQDQCTPLILQLRTALASLGQSDRAGCAAGASFALILDWAAIRPVLDGIAHRLGFEIREAALPDANETLALAASLSADPLTSRAVAFGAGQMLQQHRLFWDMLAHRRHNRLLLDGHLNGN